MTRRHALLIAAAAAIRPATGTAAPVQYILDKARSRVGFGFILGGAAQTGTMPVTEARILIDPANLAASRVDVAVSVTDARTGLIFATNALTGPQMLDAARYPTIRFVSTRVKLAPDGRLSGGATIRGNLTLRDKTRPIELQANLYRPQGTAADDLSELVVLLSGQLSRAAFGINGYRDLVQDQVTLDIRAVIRAGRTP